MRLRSKRRSLRALKINKNCERTEAGGLFVHEIWSEIRCKRVYFGVVYYPLVDANGLPNPIASKSKNLCFKRALIRCPSPNRQ